MLVGAQLQGAYLCNSQLQGANLLAANLKDADLRNADLRDTDLRAASDLKRIRWHNARLDKTPIYRHQIYPIQDEMDATNGILPLRKRGVRTPGGYHEAMETYLALKTNFSGLGNYDDAAWAYVKEQQMEKASYFPTTLGKSWLVGKLGEAPRRWWICWPGALGYRLRSAWLHVRLFLGLTQLDVKGKVRKQKEKNGETLSRWHWTRSWAFELLTGYGERPLRPVVWGLVTIAVFTAVFALAGNVSTGDPSAGLNGTHNPVDALTHSVAAFATVGFNTLEPVGWVARLLTAVESMFGISFFALFIFTIGNRMSRS